MNRSRKLVCIGIPVLILIGIGVVSARHRSISFPVPDQNSYPDFLRAAALVGATDQDYSKQADLERFVLLNKEAYPIVRSALERTCRVPVEVSQQWDTTHRGVELPSLKRLTHFMIAKAKLAEFEGRTEAAFESYKEAYRFADAIGRGGLSLDFLVSNSCRALVLHHCRSFLPSLTFEQRTEFLGMIQKSATEREAPAAVAKRTRQWRRATFGFDGQLEMWRRLLRKAWQTRSWTPLASERSILATNLLWEQQSEKAVCDRLRALYDLNETGTRH